MKILIFATHFYPHVGGVERYVEELYSRLAAQGMAVEIVTLNSKGPASEDYKGMKIHRIPAWFTLGTTFVMPNLMAWRRLRLRLQGQEFEIIVTQTRFFYTSFLGVRLAKRWGIPSLHTEHGNAPVQHPSAIIRGGAQLMDQTLGRYVLSRATAVLVIAQPGIPFVQRFGARKVTYIPNGVDTAFWRPAESKKPQEVLQLLFVGRLIAAKGLNYLLDALSELQFPWQLEVVGEGPDQAAIQDQVQQLGLTSHVHFRGRQSPQEVKNCFEKADMFINPSLSEGLPTVILEALSMEVPTVATDVGGTADILEGINKARLVPPASSQAISKAIEELRQDQKLAPARPLIIRRFDWQSVSEKVSELLRSIIDAVELEK